MKLRLALAQLNATVGDFAGNRTKIADALRLAKKRGAHLVLFPELVITGYPPEDLLFKPSFIRENLKTLESLLLHTQGLTAVMGFVDQGSSGKLYNAAAVISHGRMVGRYRKMLLPNYGVFDEKRHFAPGEKPLLLELITQWGQTPGKKGSDPMILRVGISICEDIWEREGPCRMEAKAGADLILNLSASPYHAGKHREREQLLSRRAKALKSWIAYVNLAGGQDELVFDGASLVVRPSGRIHFRASQFKEGVNFVEIPLSPQGPAQRENGIPTVPVRQKFASGHWASTPSAKLLKSHQEIFQALLLGLKDYVTKNNFKQVVVGLSGGIDSSLTAALAVAALGPRAVNCVSMPSHYSSQGTQADARRVARALGVHFMELPIERVFQTFLGTLRPVFGRARADATEENLQARIRGTLLMALSNKFGWLVLATGNKSELSTGYCTLYGDMVGGFAVMKDLPKGWVVQLSRTANRYFGKQVIPASVLRRPPTAELRPNQKDQDTLPPYRQLDAIMRAYVEEHASPAEIRRKLKVPPKVVAQVVGMIDFNEYKRRQASPGIKITPVAFGRDRRMPITNRYREGR